MTKEILKLSKDRQKVTITAGEGYLPHVKKLCKVTDTQNGYKAKFYANSSTRQDGYVLLDYSEAELLYHALGALLSRNND